MTNAADEPVPMTLLANGTRLVSLSGNDGLFHEWDLGTGFMGAAFTPSGNTIVWGNQTVEKRTFYLWTAPSWEEIKLKEAEGKTVVRQP